MSNFVIVRYACSGRRCLLWAFVSAVCAGTVLGLGMGWFNVLLDRSGTWTLPYRLLAIVLELTILLLLAISLLVLLHVRTQSVRLLFLSGFVFGFIFSWTRLTAIWILVAPGAGAFSTQTAFMGLLLLAHFVFWGVVAGVLNLGISSGIRSFRGRMIEQDGTLCWHCGYCVGSPPIAPRCSECGEEILHRPKPKSPSVVVNWLEKGMALAAVVILFLPIVVVAFRVPPYARFATDGRHITTGMFQVNATTGAMVILGSGYGVLRSVEGYPDRVLQLVVLPFPAESQPALQIQLLAMKPNGFVDYGDPMILCDLTPSQYEHMLKTGFPPSLDAELMEYSEQVGWKPNLPIPGRFGNFLFVDPARHFETGDTN